MEKVENLVICSTLNQITNFLIIRRFKPKKVFNITFEDNIKGLNINIKPKEWDKQLKDKCEGIKFEDINFSIEDILSLKKIKKKLNIEIINKIKDEKICWHVTGGQRTIALAISELIKDEKLDRMNDILIYIEGNTEKLIINNNQGRTISCKNNENSYEYKDLTFLDALNLVGFKCKSDELASTTIFKEKGKSIIQENNNEYQFYKELYRIIYSEKESKIDVGKESDTFRNLLLKSNTISEKQEERKKFISEIFEKLLEKYKDLKKIGYYQTCDKHEFDKSFPAGYIFEKLTAYKIYDLIKNNPKILGMETSLKTYLLDKEKPSKIIDEIDIVLLTNTGKIINFECKSGGMEGNNAKSHNYTTYRLAGVFGMPILLSPLYYEEVGKDFYDEKLKNQLQALRAAQVAGLEVFTIDKIKEGLQRLGIIE